MIKIQIICPKESQLRRILRLLRPVIGGGGTRAKTNCDGERYICWITVADEEVS